MLVVIFITTFLYIPNLGFLIFCDLNTFQYFVPQFWILDIFATWTLFVNFFHFQILNIFVLWTLFINFLLLDFWILFALWTLFANLAAFFQLICTCRVFAYSNLQQAVIWVHLCNLTEFWNLVDSGKEAPWCNIFNRLAVTFLNSSVYFSDHVQFL